jgi:hypothetical protein
MSDLVIHDFMIESLITVSCLNKSNFVIPPHQRFPITFVIFMEFPEIIRILSYTTNNIFFRCRLIPFQTLESKNFKSLSYVYNRAFFSLFVFQVNTSISSIVVFRKHMNSTFRKFLKKNSWMQLLVQQMS